MINEIGKRNHGTKMFEDSELPDNLYLADDVFPLSLMWRLMSTFCKKNQSPRFFPQFLVFLHSIGFIYILAAFAAAVFSDLDMTKRTASCMNPIIGLQFYYKVDTYLYNIDNYIKLLDFLKVDFMNCVPPEKEKSIKKEVAKNVEKSNKFLTYSVRLNYFVLFFVTVTPLIVLFIQRLFDVVLVEGPIKICENEFPFEWRYGPIYYVIVIQEIVCCMFAVFFSSAYEVILLLLVMSLVRHLRVVGSVIQDLKQSEFLKGGVTTSKDAREKARSQLIACVKDHQKITKAGDDLAENYNAFLTFHLGSSILVAIVATFNFSAAETSYQKGKFLSILALILLEISLYCYSGQLLEDASAELQNQVYYSEWEEMDPELRKAALLIMVRSTKPLCLTAGRLYRVNMETLGSILQLICSVYTTLATLYAG